MRAGTSSRTAETVCAWRAMAHGRTTVARYADPTARVLASDETRARIDRFFTPRGALDRASHGYLEKMAAVMVARTVAIDDAIRERDAAQLVILGAGLDGRAWRMPELAGTTVFEVDHPDTQREKRTRLGPLTQTAKEVRFVPVDFTRDALASALERAGHDRERPTTWIWEGVVMYLTPAQVDATLAVIAARSAPGSRLALLYHQPSLTVHLLGLAVRALGEPFRSQYRPEAMRALLARHGFETARDETMGEIGARLGGEVAERARSIGHLRLAIADRRAG